MRSSFEYPVSADEYAAASQYAGRRYLRMASVPWRQRVLSIAMMFSFAYALLVLIPLARAHGGARYNSALYATVAMIVLFALFAISRRVAPNLSAKSSVSREGRYTVPHRLEVEADGLRLIQGSLDYGVQWDALRSIEEVDGLLLLFLDQTAYLVIPASAFHDAAEKEAFLELLRQKMSGVQGTAQLELALESPPAPSLAALVALRPLEAFFGDLLRNLRAGARLATCRRIAPESIFGGVEQLIALAVLELLLNLLSDVLDVGLYGRPNLSGLPAALFHLPLLLLVAYIVGRREKDTRVALALPIAVLAATPYISIVSMALYAIDDSGRLDLSESWFGIVYYWGPYIWWTLVAVFALLCLTRRQLSARLVNVAVLVVLLLVPLYYVPRTAGGSLWLANPDRGGDPDRANRWYAVASEDAFYAQQEVLQKSLAALAPERPGVEDLYFVGVAGYAAQDVFRKEIDVIEPLFAERFGTAGRSVALINNPGTALQSPIASVTSLERTLARLGQVMNRDEDVLFLYLTSHGSHDHRFALEFWPLRLRDLEPAALRKMLDVSGIRWRVIVVSACYSGGFIEPLKDDHTLIVTAADPDHTSFGCGAESEFTYFGKAYFDEALRKTYSFTGAFETARATIAAREHAEGLEASNPQMAVGAEMARKLEGMERKWERRD